MEGLPLHGGRNVRPGYRISHTPPYKAVPMSNGPLSIDAGVYSDAVELSLFRVRLLPTIPKQASSNRPQELSLNIRLGRVSDLTGGEDIESRVRPLQLRNSWLGWHSAR